MLYYTLVFLIVAFAAGILGFGLLAGVAMQVAQILFVIFLVLLVVSLVSHGTRRATSRRGV